MRKEALASPPVHIVWAKIKGYPWWPATTSTYPKQLTVPQKYRVDFFNESSHSFVPGNMMVEFRTNYEVYSANKNRKLIEAVKLAEILEKELKDSGSKGSKNEQESPAIVQQQLIIQMEVEIPEPESSRNQELSKNQTSDGRKSYPQSEGFNCPIALIMGSQRKISEIDQEVHCYYKPNRHRTITKLTRSGSSAFMIPYRRYYDQKYQMRIIDILNKIHLGKVNQNDISRLMKRIKNLDKKHLFNKYILSGLVQMLKMLEEKSHDSTSVTSYQYQSLVQEVREKLEKLKREIADSLGSTTEIQEEMVEEGSDDAEEDTPTDILEELSVADRRKAFVQKIYRIMKGKNKKKEGEAVRKESLRILSIFQRLLQRKSMGKVKQLLRDLIESEVNTDQLEMELKRWEQEENNTTSKS